MTAPRLLKLSIPKSSLAVRHSVKAWLFEHGLQALLPAKRGPADALRVALSYTLRDWTQWKGQDGEVYRAIAASPTEQKGLCVDINVQVRKPDGVSYTASVCRIQAPEQGEPTCWRSDSYLHFPDLWNALQLELLLPLGQDHLFEPDLRRLAEDFLADGVQRLWKGMWLTLGDCPGLQHVTHLATLLSAGSLSVQTLTLENSQANRAQLAQELAGEYLRQFEALGKRLAYPKPQVAQIESEYMKLVAQLRSTEELLGVAVPCLGEQIDFEQRLMQAEA